MLVEKEEWTELVQTKNVDLYHLRTVQIKRRMESEMERPKLVNISDTGVCIKMYILLLYWIYLFNS